MLDDPKIYINSSTPGFTSAFNHSTGDLFDVIFDEAYTSPDGVGSFKPAITCAAEDADGIESRKTILTINNIIFQVASRPQLDGMGLAYITLQDRTA